MGIYWVVITGKILYSNFCKDDPPNLTTAMKGEQNTGMKKLRNSVGTQLVEAECGFEPLDIRNLYLNLVWLKHNSRTVWIGICYPLQTAESRTFQLWRRCLVPYPGQALRLCPWPHHAILSTVLFALLFSLVKYNQGSQHLHCGHLKT